ncbi:MAG: Holliday junction resolvase RecU [Erysipelotrichaceae bacterium]|jgi:recombination protein U|nr:Holliday junction resolvase RecU [Erysipelotrichaceae bacterium]
MIKYPSGAKQKTHHEVNSQISSANRGVYFENLISISLKYYEEKGIAYIIKRPTPIKIVKVDYSHGQRIVEAYFEKQSTVDYSGIYKKRFVCFEAKSHIFKTSFPLSNVSIHQMDYLKKMEEQQALSFFLIELKALNKIFLIPSSYIITYETNYNRKSIPLSEIAENGILVEQGINPRIKIIEAIDKIL